MAAQDLFYRSTRKLAPKVVNPSNTLNLAGSFGGYSGQNRTLNGGFFYLYLLPLLRAEDC